MSQSLELLTEKKSFFFRFRQVGLKKRTKKDKKCSGQADKLKLPLFGQDKFLSSKKQENVCPANFFFLFYLKENNLRRDNFFPTCCLCFNVF